MSMKSQQGLRTPGSHDECRTAPDGRRHLDQAHGFEPLARLPHSSIYIIFVNSCTLPNFFTFNTLNCLVVVVVRGLRSFDAGDATRNSRSNH